MAALKLNCVGLGLVDCPTQLTLIFMILYLQLAIDTGIEYKIWRPAQKCDGRQQKWQHPGEAGIHSDLYLCLCPNNYYQEGRLTNMVTFVACYNI